MSRATLIHPALCFLVKRKAKAIPISQQQQYGHKVVVTPTLIGLKAKLLISHCSISVKINYTFKVNESPFNDIDVAS
jgi:hypothetical protein